MVLFLQVVFFFSVFCLLHSYVLYPLILALLARNKQANRDIYLPTDQLPFVSVMVAIYNEEKVIAKKLQTLLQSNYPQNKLNIYVGSDCSTDASNDIVADLA
ncbi:MAG: glycosyltransferase, partial [Bacteroidota bacterium]